MKVESGIIIGRMNPPHIGHVELIKKSLQENDSTYVYIGIKKQSDERNPFSFEEIKIFLLLIFSKEVQESILKIDFIGDVDTDREWAENIFEKIKSSVQGKYIHFYGGDLENDYAIQVLQDNRNLFKNFHITFKEFDRYKYKVFHGGVYKDISATYVRELLRNKNYQLLESVIDENILHSLIEQWKKKI